MYKYVYMYIYIIYIYIKTIYWLIIIILWNISMTSALRRKKMSRMSWSGNVGHRCQLQCLRAPANSKSMMPRDHKSTFDPVAFALKDLDLVDFNGNCLVVSTYPSEKSWSSSAGIMTFPTEWKVIQNSMVPVTTNQGFLDDLVLSVHLRSHVVGCADHSVGTTFQLAQFLGNLRGAWSAPEISESGVTWELFLAKGPEFWRCHLKIDILSIKNVTKWGPGPSSLWRFWWNMMIDIGFGSMEDPT